MKRVRRSLSPLRTSLRLGLLVLALAAGSLMVLGAGPAWWTQRGVVNGPPDDYAVANQGQLKNIALAAFKELDEKLPGGAGDALKTHLNQWTQVTQGTRVAKVTAGVTDDYAAVNLGQLKAVAEPFYARLIEIHFFDQYPWAGNSDNYALANLGQLKNVFSFDLTIDSDHDGLTDLIELGLHTDPKNGDSDGDGINDGVEVAAGGEPNYPDNPLLQFSAVGFTRP